MTEPPKVIFVGGNGSPSTDEVEHGKDLARRYRCEFVDLKNFQIQHELFRKIPVELMFRYNFVPLEEKPDGRLVIAIADPSQLMMIDEIGLLLARRIVDRAWPRCRRSPTSSRRPSSRSACWTRPAKGLTFDVIAGDENADENISIEKLTARRRHQPHHPPGGYHHLHRAGAPRQRHSHRNPRRFGGGEVPH